MARSARLSEVAKLAGVSPGLVSRLINEDPTLKIRDETRERVQAAIDMLQYTPHASARALRSSQTGLLGFALYHVTDPIYAQMVENAEAAASVAGYSLMLLNAADLAAHPQTLRSLAQGRKVDGLLIQGGYEDHASLQGAGSMPTVLFNADALAGFRTVRLDDAEAAALATRHLIDLGHTAIAFVGAEGSSSDRRYQGYLSAMVDAGLASHPPIVGGWDAGTARSVVENYYASGGSATALVVVSTTSALGVHAGVIASERRVGQDVSMVSIHDTWFAPHLSPALTVAAMPLGDLGRVAVEMLLEQIREPAEGEVILREPEIRIVHRESSAPPAA
ncbi:LacI family DNA-binding transcriptional regulator [Microbacterium sp. YMB-B2]|uniref:LacI family DNA-binding transcriptional regulator n=1 Tax=Microbacterium tenebrionis TaxID=2830665 RepID=A0A9X1RYV7_9MICO|nr:LacI family DNA-binding transcriptional regulator [Microbacterium tenebrionis]MCC2028079.1 LacI family DNA-binding transcriptional regulator [Microbacterium tenebrionis]